MSEQKLSDPPQLVALCEWDDDDEEQVVGWAMVLPDQVVGYIPGPEGGGGASTYTFASLDSAELILSYSGTYPVTDLSTLPGRRGPEDRPEDGATLPHALDRTAHRGRS